ncbi:MAG TPA: NAD(+) kinase [Solibacterales bacterium]|nr:NAD(+) kinase [Bryobacterales bacterium]
MDTIKTVGIVSKPGVAQAKTLLPKLIEWAKARGISVRYDEETAAYLGTVGTPRHLVPDNTQLVIVFGGDGTLLSAARAIAGREIPLFAVNLGGLGFLTAITIDEVFVELDRALHGEHRIGRREMLRCELVRQGKVVAEYNALNDVVVTKASLARMIDIEAYVSTHFVTAYKADGLIISTPTGSTAYSLSAGGPVIFPQVEAWCITPICPHMLTNRPVIVPDDSVIRLVCKADDDVAFLTVDGQVGEPLKQNDEVLCRSSQRFVHLIRPPKMKFFDVLREKLNWGMR